MKLTEYLKKEVPKLEDLLLLDGADGTNVITFENLSKALKTLNEIKSSDQLYDWLDSLGLPWDVRNTIYRGKYLGTTLTKEQAKSITDKTFKGLFLSDYWGGRGFDERSNTYFDNVPYGIYGFNYWFRKGHYTKEVTSYHIAIMPSKYALLNSNVPSQNTSKGYLGLHIHEYLHQKMPSCISNITSKTDDILTRQAFLTNAASNGVPTSSVVVDNVKFVLPTLAMLNGCSTHVLNGGTESELLPLAEFGWKYIRDGDFNGTMVRDIAGANSLYDIGASGGEIITYGVSQTMLYRPVFGLTGEATAS